MLAVSQMNAASISELFIDAGSGNTADILVDTIGAVTCSGAGCGGLTIPSAITPHGSLMVTGAIGNFDITTIAGVGGLGVIPPALLNLTQNEARTAGAGDLLVKYSDTDFCLGGGPCWGGKFNVAVQSNPDFALSASTLTGAALADSANTLLGGAPIDGPFTLTGVDTHVSTVNNPFGSGSGGSLSAITQFHFSGAGHIQSSFTISSAGVPEPGTVGLLGIGAGMCLLGLWRKKRA